MSRIFLFCSAAGAMMLSVAASAAEPADAAKLAAKSAGVGARALALHMAQGQDASQAAAAPIGAACRKPELVDRPRITAQEIERTTAAVQDYVDCMRPILEAQRKAAEEKLADAKATAEASNAAATEVNALVDAYRKWAAEHKDDESR